MLELTTPWSFRIESSPSFYNARAVPIHPSTAHIAAGSTVLTPLLVDREQSSAPAYAASAPAPGPEAGLLTASARFEEANREWFRWRFGEEA